MDRAVTILRGADATRTELADRTGPRSLLMQHFGSDLPEVERMKVPAIPEWD